jgi:hypothetical protein
MCSKVVGTVVESGPLNVLAASGNFIGRRRDSPRIQPFRVPILTATAALSAWAPSTLLVPGARGPVVPGHHPSAPPPPGPLVPLILAPPPGTRGCPGTTGWGNGAPQGGAMGHHHPSAPPPPGPLVPSSEGARHRGCPGTTGRAVRIRIQTTSAWGPAPSTVENHYSNPGL